MHPFFAVPLVTLLCFMQPTVCLRNQEKAIIPTAPGQIGVNPVDPLTDLGPPSKW